MPFNIHRTDGGCFLLKDRVNLLTTLLGWDWGFPFQRKMPSRDAVRASLTTPNARHLPHQQSDNGHKIQLSEKCLDDRQHSHQVGCRNQVPQPDGGEDDEAIVVEIDRPHRLDSAKRCNRRQHDNNTIEHREEKSDQQVDVRRSQHGLDCDRAVSEEVTTDQYRAYSGYREYRMPAVVSLRGISNLVDDTTVAVDGFKGEVVIIPTQR